MGFHHLNYLPVLTAVSFFKAKIKMTKNKKNKRQTLVKTIDNNTHKCQTVHYMQSGGSQLLSHFNSPFPIIYSFNSPSGTILTSHCVTRETLVRKNSCCSRGTSLLEDLHVSNVGQQHYTNNETHSLSHHSPYGISVGLQ